MQEKSLKDKGKDRKNLMGRAGGLMDWRAQLGSKKSFNADAQGLRKWAEGTGGGGKSVRFEMQNFSSGEESLQYPLAQVCSLIPALTHSW